MGGKCSKPARLVGQQLTARQALDQALRQAAEADLRTDQCTGQHGACLVLSTTIDGLQHTGLEIAWTAIPVLILVVLPAMIDLFSKREGPPEPPPHAGEHAA